MSRNGKRPKNWGSLPPFVPLAWDLLNSPAYKSLPPSASKALPYYLGKVKLSPKDPERYEQVFDFSYREGHKMGFAFAGYSDLYYPDQDIAIFFTLGLG